jgi:hypothetical protein
MGYVGISSTRIYIDRREAKSSGWASGRAWPFPPWGFDNMAPVAVVAPHSLADHPRRMQSGRAGPRRTSARPSPQPECRAR